jgi:DNA-binding response OmpR family regulator
MAEKYPNVLLLEDDQQFGKVIRESLELKNYRVDWLRDAGAALERITKKKYDLYLVDIGLPGMPGTEFVKELRKSDYVTPILFMSANSSDNDKIHAFCAGGDDFIAKPFTITELSLRIYALLRRTNPTREKPDHPSLFAFGDFTFDYTNRMLCSPAGEENLTRKEAEVLRLLAVNLNNVVKREVVLTDVWGENDYFMGRSMDVYIARLRKKLERDRRVAIVNVHRLGFKLEGSA